MIVLFPSRAVVLEIFGFSVHWYGIMYLLAFLLSFLILPRLQRFRGLKLSVDDWSSLLSWGIIGVVIGGRIGFILFYNLPFYLANPLKVFAVWEGGMSSHGGFIGVALAVAIWASRRKVSVLALADCIVVPAAVGLALGRIGNFINGELYGPVTDLPWGVRFPGVSGLRHPTQLYAVAKDLFIASVCLLHLARTGVKQSGRTAALFLMLYGLLRFLIEYLRVQDHPLVSIGVLSLSRGQLLTIPVFVLGAVLGIILRIRRGRPFGAK